MALFSYAPEIFDAFPGIVGGVIHATGVANGPSSRELTEAFRAGQSEALARVGAASPSEIPQLAAWRRAFRTFGVDPTQYRSAAEALLRRLTKQGEIPSISTLVDLANLASIRHVLPVAVFDLQAVGGRITVRSASGEETWADLGASTTDRPMPGEVIFVDEAETVLARRWCWRQSVGSAASEGTSEILVTVEGHHEGAADDVRDALDDLEGLLRTHAGASNQRRAILTREKPAFG